MVRKNEKIWEELANKFNGVVTPTRCWDCDIKKSKHASTGHKGRNTFDKTVWEVKVKYCNNHADAITEFSNKTKMPCRHAFNILMKLKLYRLIGLSFNASTSENSRTVFDKDEIKKSRQIEAEKREQIQQLREQMSEQNIQ